MLKSMLSSPRISVLEQALAASSLRHKVISNNIANVNTPGFKKSEVAFESILQGSMDGERLFLRRTNGKHIPLSGEIIKPVVTASNSTTMRTDGNNVDVDAEMAALVKNNIYYDAVANQVNRYFAGLKSVIREGK